jgi:hypothetical protein
VWELLWADDVPDGVAISEAVELAQDLSTDGSPAFVNGLLAKIAAIKADEPAISRQSEADPGPAASLDPQAGHEPEPEPEAARSQARSAGLVRPKISSVLRPASDPAEAESDPGD